jgi:hypothetical protein
MTGSDGLKAGHEGATAVGFGAGGGGPEAFERLSLGMAVVDVSTQLKFNFRVNS